MSDKPHRFRWMQHITIIAALLFVVGSICVVVALQLRPIPLSLPFTATDVESMEAHGVYVRRYDTEKTFQVPPSYWETILSSLSTGHKDDHPTKWEVGGELELKRKDGESYFIMLSNRDQFAAGPTFDKRVYYRGANDGELKQAVIEAYEASQQKK
jgi:hypothetical protein